MRKWMPAMAVMLASACGEPVLDVGHDPVPGRYATPETIRAEAHAAPGVATVIASRQFSIRSMALDEKRLYWLLEGVGDTQNSDEALRERGVIRSCEPNNCAATVVTHATDQINTSGIVVGGGKIYWSVQNGSGMSTIFACSVGASGEQPEFIVQVPSAGEIAVDGTSLFWLGGVFDLVRCSLSDCPNTLVTLAKVGTLSEFDPFTWGRLVLGPSEIYWIEGPPDAKNPGAIMTMPKDGSLPPRVLVTGLHAPLRVAATATDIAWIEYYSLGEIRSCSLLDCPNGPTTIAIRQPYVNLLAAEGAGVYWFGRRGYRWEDDLEVAPADLFECPRGGCGDASQAVLTVETKVPRQTAVDRTHVYWISRGDVLDGSPPNRGPYEGSIKRIRRTR